MMNLLGDTGNREVIKNPSMNSCNKFNRVFNLEIGLRIFSNVQEHLLLLDGLAITNRSTCHWLHVNTKPPLGLLCFNY